MQTTVRTTLRIRKNLLDQFRVLALKMEEIDRFRKSLKGRKINIQKILEESKKDQK